MEHGHVFPALTVDTSSNIVAGRQVLEASREEQPGGEAVEGGEAREGEPALHARAVPREGTEDPRVSHCPADKIIIRQSQVETCVPIYKSCLMLCLLKFRMEMERCRSLNQELRERLSKYEKVDDLPTM